MNDSIEIINNPLHKRIENLRNKFCYRTLYELETVLEDKPELYERYKYFLQTMEKYLDNNISVQPCKHMIDHIDGVVYDYRESGDITSDQKVLHVHGLVGSKNNFLEQINDPNLA